MGTTAHRAPVPKHQLLGVTLEFTFSPNLECEGHVCVICKVSCQVRGPNIRQRAWADN